MSTEQTASDPLSVVFGLFGLGNLLNGLWMLYDPPHWFVTLPAGVPDFGPLNEHFIRDIGCIFALMGLALLYAAARPKWRLAASAAVTAFLLMHAFVHVIDTVRGLVGPEHWAIDFPGVYLPAFVMTALTYWIRQQESH